MAKELKFTCDRCNSVVISRFSLNVEVLPDSWGFYLGKHLCGDCVRDLDSFLRGSRIEYIAVDRGGAVSPDLGKGE